MRKNLLALMFVVALLCGGALVVSAKTSSSPANSASVAKKAKAIANKIITIKPKCNTDCVELLELLLVLNEEYEASCAPTYFWLCERGLSDLLIDVGDEYNANCAGGNQARNSNRNTNQNKLAIDRNKIVRESRSKSKV